MAQIDDDLPPFSPDFLNRDQGARSLCVFDRKLLGLPLFQLDRGDVELVPERFRLGGGFARSAGSAGLADDFAQECGAISHRSLHVIL